MFTVEKLHKHTWKFLKTSIITLDFDTYKVDRYQCLTCEQVYSVDNDTGQRIDLRGMVGEEAT